MLKLVRQFRLSISLPSVALLGLLGACAPLAQSQRAPTAPSTRTASAAVTWGFAPVPAQPSGPKTWGFVPVPAAQLAEPTYWGFVTVPVAQRSEPTLWGFLVPPDRATPAVQPAGDATIAAKR